MRLMALQREPLNRDQEISQLPDETGTCGLYTESAICDLQAPKFLQLLARTPFKGPLIESLWRLVVGIWGILDGIWGSRYGIIGR